MNAWLRRWYGAGVTHLVAIAAGLTISGYAAWKLVPRAPVGVVVWIIGGALLHDLVLVPVYTAAFMVLHRVTRRLPNQHAVNHIRIPAMLAGILLLVFFPLILRRPAHFEGITGFSTAPYLKRWLAITVGLYAASAVGYLVGVVRRARRGPIENDHQSAKVRPSGVHDDER